MQLSFSFFKIKLFCQIKRPHIFSLFFCTFLSHKITLFKGYIKMIKSKSEPQISKEGAFHTRVGSTGTSVRADEKITLCKLRKLHFKARLSSFDTSNTETNKSTFRGFFTLFWIAMGFYVILTLVHCYEKDGIMLSLEFFQLMSKDTLVLLIADLCMIGQTFVVVPFAKLMMKDKIHYRPVGVIIQHIAQTLFIFGNLYWVFWRYDTCNMYTRLIFTDCVYFHNS